MRLCLWSLALSIPVLGLERICPRKGCPWPRIFLCPWPWPRALCSGLHLCPFSPLHLQNIFKPRLNLRSQKFAMRWGCFGSLGAEPPKAIGDLGAKPPEAGGLGEKSTAVEGLEVWGRSPQRSKILHFVPKIT